MKVPVSWLRGYFSAPLDPVELAERFTLSGIEVDRLQHVGASDPLIVVAEIVSVSSLVSHNGVFRLKVRADRERELVSNAPGLAVGQKLAIALPGATLYQPGFEGLEEVRAGDIYGVRSEAVLVSRAALGAGANSTDPVFFDAAAEPGTPVSRLLSPEELAQAEIVLHLAILPNIARCQSMQGVAREVGALLGREVNGLEQPSELKVERRLQPAIVANDAASVLSLTLLENVRVTESPLWLKRRILLAGMTPINNVVDASNYVMLELGEPNHPYDADGLPSLDLQVRRARAGERLSTLQQNESEEPLRLPEGIPLIVSADLPVAIAGVIGGRSASISASTRRVLLEAAAFDYVAIRRSQQAAKTYTEASARFSRGVNPELPGLAARRFVEVLRETSPELLVAAQGEASSGVPPERTIELSLADLNASLGTSFELTEVTAYLRRTGARIRIDSSQQRLWATVGNSRPDLTQACDLMEEVARIAGYDRIPETMPNEPIPERLHQDAVQAREHLRDLLVRCDLQEILSYALSGPELEARVYAGHPGSAPPRAVAVLNPVSVERSVLRTSLLPALLETAALNLRHSPVCRLFEIGAVFSPKPDARDLPEERERVAVLLGGSLERPTLQSQKPRSLDFFDLKSLLFEVFSSLGLASDLRLEPAESAPFRPGAAATIRRGERVYGCFGAVHPSVLRAFDLEQQPLFVAELSLSALLETAAVRRPFRDYDRLPSIELDIAMFVTPTTTAQAVSDVVVGAAGPLLRESELFDQFSSAEFGDKKSMAIRLRLNAGGRTLEMAEAIEVRTRVARALERELSATIRE